MKSETLETFSIGRFRISIRFLKFLFGGGVATFTNLLILYVLTDFFHIWYLTSSILSVSISIFVSFGLQKFWAFKDHDNSKIKWQLPLYIALVLINLAINTGLVYLFVEYTHMWYILAQTISSGIVAVGSFFAFKFLIFKK